MRPLLIELSELVMLQQPPATLVTMGNLQQVGTQEDASLEKLMGAFRELEERMQECLREQKELLVNIDEKTQELSQALQKDRAGRCQELGVVKEETSARLTHQRETVSNQCGPVEAQVSNVRQDISNTHIASKLRD